MRTNRVAVRLLVVAVLFLLGTLGPSALAESDKLVVRVMTRNMDAGTDLNYVVGVADPVLFAQGVIRTVDEVLLSNIPGRAAALAAEIAQSQPDVVALQEVTTWQIAAPPGVTVVLDQLDILMQALQTAGLHYRVAVAQDLTDIPVAIPGYLDLRFTDHDAILVRTDLPPGHLDVLGTETHLYQNRLSFDTPVGPIPVLRGWIAADLKVRGARFKLANTHLESIAPSAFELTSLLQMAQGMELLAGLEEAKMPVILAGDFNSDAELAGIGPDQSLTATYISGSGYTDAWRALHTNPADKGFTWPLFLEDQFPTPTAPATPVERIDLIFSLGPIPIGVDRIGAGPGLAGIYASDHAGVFATFALQNFRR